jgi:hypothetical protein
MRKHMVAGQNRSETQGFVSEVSTNSVLDGRGLIGYPMDIIHWTGYGSSFLGSNGYPLDNLQG